MNLKQLQNIRNLILVIIQIAMIIILHFHRIRYHIHIQMIMLKHLLVLQNIIVLEHTPVIWPHKSIQIESNNENIYTHNMNKPTWLSLHSIDLYRCCIIVQINWIILNNNITRSYPHEFNLLLYFFRKYPFHHNIL